VKAIFNVKNGSFKTIEAEQAINFETVKAEAVRMLIEATSSHIYSNYPDIKQKSDLSDKEYFETYLKIRNIDEIAFRKALAEAVEKVYSGVSDFDTEVSALKQQFPTPAGDVEWELAIEQLLKVSIRVMFVQLCKAVHRQLKTQIEQATNENELPDLNNIPFPRLPL